MSDRVNDSFEEAKQLMIDERIELADMLNADEMHAQIEREFGL